MMEKKKIGQKASIVIVDDNVNYCYVLSEAINRSKLFYCEKYYHTARLAEKALKATDYPPRILLLDINMPEVSGLDAIVAFKKLLPEILIVMLTSFDDESDIITSLQRGADGYINKSTNHVDLLHSLERLLKGGKTIDPKIAEKLIHATLGPSEVPDYKLTNREMETLKFFARGFGKTKIAREMNISYYTVESHRKNLFEKMKVHTCAEMVAKALKEKLVV